MGSPVRRRRLVANTITAKPTASPPTTKNITTASQDTLRTARPQDQFAEFTHVGRPPLKRGKNSASVLRQHGAFSAVLCWLPTLIQCGSFVLFGTHPEAVKLAPLVRELRNHPRIHTDVINSGQHGDAPPKLLEELGVQTDEDLGTVTSGISIRDGGVAGPETARLARHTAAGLESRRLAPLVAGTSRVRPILGVASQRRASIFTPSNPSRWRRT